MAQVKIVENEIWAKFDIKDVKRLRVGILGGEVKEVEIHTKNGGVYVTDSEFYVYCLQRMTELNVFIDIETFTAVAYFEKTRR